MASKEITTYIVDLSLGMSERRKGREVSDLEYGLEVIYEELVAKMLRGRKTDFVTVICCHSRDTNNIFANEEEFRNIEVVVEKIVPTFDNLCLIRGKLAPNMDERMDSEGDLFDAVLVGVGLMKDTQRLKFIRNVVIVTNGEDQRGGGGGSKPPAFREAARRAINEMNVNVTVNFVDFDDVVGPSGPPKSGELVFEFKRANATIWREIVQEYANGRILDTKDFKATIQEKLALRRVKPIKYFSGSLRLGRDPDSDELAATFDQSGIAMEVEMYPAAKPEKLPAGHQFIVDLKNKKIDKIKSKTDYFIKKHEENEPGFDADKRKSRVRYTDADDDENDDGGEFEKVFVNAGDRMDGFKYSNYDLIALDEDILSSSKLRCQSGMDILGIVRCQALPYSYFTGESYYLLPSTVGSKKDVVGFEAVCRSLAELESVALVRFVQKEDGDIQIGALFPTFTTKDKKTIYFFIFVRLPYKEDERIGRFPSLTHIVSTSGKKYVGAGGKWNMKDGDEGTVEVTDRLPDQETNDLMEQYISAMDIDKNRKEVDAKAPDPHQVNSLSNTKLFMDHDPQFKPQVGDMIYPSPAIEKFNKLLKKIIFKALESNEELNSFLNNPTFVQDILLDKEEGATNLLNLHNIFPKNLDSVTILYGHTKAVSLAQTLRERLETDFIEAEKNPETGKRKNVAEDALDEQQKLKRPHGNYGEDDINLEKIPNIDDLLD